MTGSCSHETTFERSPPGLAAAARLEKHGINDDYYTTNMYFQDVKFGIKENLARRLRKAGLIITASAGTSGASYRSRCRAPATHAASCRSPDRFEPGRRSDSPLRRHSSSRHCPAQQPGRWRNRHQQPERRPLLNSDRMDGGDDPASVASGARGGTHCGTSRCRSNGRRRNCRTCVRLFVSTWTSPTAPPASPNIVSPQTRTRWVRLISAAVAPHRRLSRAGPCRQAPWSIVHRPRCPSAGTRPAADRRTMPSRSRH